ncbi:hypothetical protein [Parapedobacter composti]|nr:hypothetical protein [Parapedobacter composti]
MIDRFIEEVRNACLDLGRRQSLPGELENPSPANLKIYCLKLVNGLSREDKQTFTEFFNPFNEDVDLATRIEKFDLDKLKPLQHFITGRTTKPKENIAKLAAVLIDFHPRPYSKWRDAANSSIPDDIAIEKDNSGDADVPHTEGDGLGAEVKPAVGDMPPSEKKSGEKPSKFNVWLKLWKPVLYGTVALTIVAAALSSARKQCMYWKVDRYVPVHCHEKIADVEIIPVDRDMVKRFRKITQPDTLTLNSVGKVWYGKPTPDSAEFYTMAGSFPKDRRKELKPASEYIIKKYVLNKHNKPQ